MGHASIGETEGTYGHLVREHHERDVDALDVAFQAAIAPGDDVGTRKSRDSRRPAAFHCVPPAASQPLSVDQRDEELMVEGKGFEDRDPKFLENLRDAIVRNAAKRGRPRPTASHP
jgi:hypothetical protein